ncbi:SEL1-like repeat protein [Alteromonas sp. KUL49]|uniref:tetratricopeptide repeat protein n=1 Tax=Alteromonas sp. KUL49 TaxID=2480798 RepID=UPI00102EE244|nr:SEL1-like repeat protein [Alteromonas sp. KUL49]TAP37299.1 sel1 repeat family protein [Alteromonas sp. KUL49]GEA12920.1 hypothetical protein KUL49_32950 [Alteromonas sp. KUL49]
MFKAKLLASSVLFFSSLVSADIFKADSQFTNQEYSAAYEGYLAASKLGNPHAHYQLANMYMKGLGVEQDMISAILYYALAAEYDFHNANAVLQSIYDSLPEETVSEVSKLIDGYIAQHGKVSINNAYFPVILEDKLSTKIMFGEDTVPQTKFYSEEVELQDYFDEFEDEEGNISLEINALTPPQPPILVIDHDIHWDGSVRHTEQLQKYGGTFDGTRELMDGIANYPLEVPTFDGKPVEFLSRAYMGAAVYDKFTLVRRYENAYEQILRQSNRLKTDPSLNAQYQYATALINFPWLKQDEGEAERILASLANLGHSPAMLEYGLLLYREQRELPAAIHWIAESAKYGLTRAEYRLGKLLQSSPWVFTDDSKALFWFELAAQDGHVQATLRAIEILLLSNNENIRNPITASSYLDSIAESQARNPEYFYLRAQLLRQAEEKDFKQIFDDFRQAILLGNQLNWDVSDWQALLDRMMQGNITIGDEGLCEDNDEQCG